MRRIGSRFIVLIAAATFGACGGIGSDTAANGMVDAKAAQAEADAAMQDTPIPPGASLSVTIRDQSGSYEVGYGRSAVEGLAMCEWFRFWLKAIAADSAADVKLAADAADRFPTWEIYIGASQSYRDLVNSVVDKARLGDPGPMSQFVTANCGPSQ